MLKRSWHHNKYALLFLSPWLIGVIFIVLYPTIYSLYLSFTSFNMTSPPNWIGLGNYKQLFADSRYLQSLKVTLIYVFLGVPLQLIMALALALVLNRGVKGLSWFRAVYYVPSLLGPSVAIAILWSQVFGQQGLFNHVLGFFGVSGTSWIGDPSTSLYTIILLLVWQFGSPMVIFLAGLKQIPSDVYEAAAIDGAGRVKTFFKITLPMLSPIIFFNVVMQMVGAFQAFTPAYVIGGTSGGPLDSDLFYTLYLYISAFTEFRMGYANAMAWMLMLIIGLFTFVLFRLSKKWVHYEN